MKALLNIVKLIVVMTVVYFLSNYLIFETTGDELVEMDVSKAPVWVFNGRYIEGYNSKLYNRAVESSNANS